MSASAHTISELNSWHGFSTNKQPKTEPESNWNKPEGPQSSKRLISKACRQVLMNPDSTQKEILQASAILEKIIRLKELGSARKRLNPKTKKVKNSPINDILERASNS